MKPCKACGKAYGEPPCTGLGHCVFEGSGEQPEVPQPMENGHGLQIRQTI